MEPSSEGKKKKEERERVQESTRKNVTNYPKKK